MKEFRALYVPGLIAAMCLALLAQESQGRGQGAPGADPAAGARGGQVPPAPGGAAGARGGQGAPAADATGTRGGQGGNRGGGQGGAQAGGRGGGGGPKNVQVLIGADLPTTMQSYVQALGLLEK